MALLAVLLALAAPAAAHADGRWRWPVRGEVVTPFHVKPDPFARGQHRGIDIAARAGATVRSACPGRVRFAGPVPGRGRAVTVRCGPLVATYLELATTAVVRGATVSPGDRLGTVAASHLQLGARRAGWRNGYVDPLSLLTTPEPPPLGATPRDVPRPPRAQPHPVAWSPGPRTPAPDAARIPLPAWGGLALLAAGTPLGALWHRRRCAAQRLAIRAIDETA